MRFIAAHKKLFLGLGAILLLAYIFCLPRELFKDPLSVVLEDRNGTLLSARIAADGQWRFPESDSLPDKFIQCITTFEDKRFFSHPGVDLIGFGRAMLQNIRNGRIVSGGSTLTMQVIRLSRKNKARSIKEKLIEMVMATRLEFRYSKEEILRLYAGHAPFGGNVVGLNTACWRYYGKKPALLSWGEAALLAVLPNSPALLHPGKNRNLLLQKRNRLLDRLFENGQIDQTTMELAKLERIPNRPLPLPDITPHLLDRISREAALGKSRGKSVITTTIDIYLQRQVQSILQRHHQRLKENEIHNLAAVVFDIQTNEVLAYIGNVKGAGSQYGEAVDIADAPRSTGSILKPFLYAMAVEDGTILPQSLLKDIPTILKGYRPENYSKQFNGVVPAKEALYRSLNVPFVRLLQRYGVEKFHHGLQKMHFHTINRPANHYGLTLILGGAETTLWDVTNAYAGMGKTLNHFYPNSGQYNPADFDAVSFVLGDKKPKKKKKLTNFPSQLSAAGIWFALEAMKEVKRPDMQGNWQYFESAQPIAWKTGTSFGFRDAWAVGITPRYAVGIWVGNADGKGRPGLVGVKAAAPVLFDIFDLLPNSESWFATPYDEMKKALICRESGYLATPICPIDTMWVPLRGLEGPSCHYHQWVHLDTSEQYRVNADCESVGNIINKPWFVLSALEEYYYKPNHPDYRSLPPLRSDCSGSDKANTVMELIYPKKGAKIFLPVDLGGKMQSTIFKAVHKRKNATIYWHLDEAFLGKTVGVHNWEFHPTVGRHLLTLVDEDGNRLEQWFEIISE